MADSFIKIDDQNVKRIFQKEETLNIETLKRKRAYIQGELDKVDFAIAEALKLGVVAAADVVAEPK
tara:strand:- start:1228 stop:1425 length:198 start_codon:yes stop_codon:yes gene_type:complete